MPGSFDDYSPVEQMQAIGRTLTHLGWSPQRPQSQKCGCQSCSRPADSTTDDGPVDDRPPIGAFDDDSEDGEI